MIQTGSITADKADRKVKNMTYIVDRYTVSYKDKDVGYYSVFDNGEEEYDVGWGSPWDIEKELKELGLDKEFRVENKNVFSAYINEKNRLPGRRIRYQLNDVLFERHPNETDEVFSVYRRSAEEGAPDYSPLHHDAPHYEGPHTPEGMKEWCNYYEFVKMDDGTYEAVLDEAWWWGGSHNDGGTIHTEIPEEWFELPYDEFLSEVVTVAAAGHYGFTAEMLKERKGLKEFFGYK